MNHPQLIEIANAKNQIDAANAMNESFLAHARAHSLPQDVPSKLEFSDQAIQVQAFGYIAEAIPRVVRAEDGGFYVEYVFYVRSEQEPQEVFRFYLTSSGRLVESLGTDASASICDVNNPYIAKHLCGRVMLGILRSPLFLPLTKQGD